MAVHASGAARDVTRALGVSFSRYRLSRPLDRLRRVGRSPGSACGRRRHHEHRRPLGHGPPPQLARRRADEPHPRRAFTGRRGSAGRHAARHRGLRRGPHVRRRQVLDAGPDQQSLRREQPFRRWPQRQGQVDRAGRVRAEHRDRHEQLPHVLRTAQQGDGRAGCRRISRPTRKAASKPRSTSRKLRPRRRARRSFRTKHPTPVSASTTCTTRSSPTTAPRSCRPAGATANPMSRRPGASSTRWQRSSSRPPRRARACSRRAATPDPKAVTTAARLRRARPSTSTIRPATRSSLPWAAPRW